jgi:drug/metabolite transporter (DMT)-like permease
MNEFIRRVPGSMWRLYAAFLAVYIIWGSTYLAIRFSIETLPPFLMGGSRFLLAGGLLFAWARWRGAAIPALAHWRTAAIIGGLLLLGGNGGVVWAEQRVDSGLTALLITSEPIWIVVLNWLGPRGHRPNIGVILGLLLGLAGIGLLLGPGNIAGGSRIDLIGAGVLFLATLSWAAGSLYSSRAHMPESAVMATAMQMLCGGALLLLLGLSTGEWHRLNLLNVSVRSALSVLYLILFGSIVAFSAYYYLLRNATPTRASTYAFVNPVVAVFLGWAFAGERITSQTLLATVVIVVGVMLIIFRGHAGEGSSPEECLEVPHERQLTHGTSDAARVPVGDNERVEVN